MKLPYRVKTETGEIFDIDFALHRETENPVRVGQILSLLLEAIDRESKVAGPVSNGDVLQATAMALAVRAQMIEAPINTTASLSEQLLRSALHSVADAAHRSPKVGHA